MGRTALLPSLMEHAATIQEGIRPIIQDAERLAREGASIESALRLLRRLGLDDFGILLLTMPNKDFPALSELLPRMASMEVQSRWNGSHGPELLRQTTSFARTLDLISWRYLGRGLSDRQILDFGCGWGRISRLMYYFTDPINLTGVDAWERSLSIARADGIPNRLVKSDPVPLSLPVDAHDVTYAYSILTHLPAEAASAVLAALREVTRDLLVVTVRPIEFWPYYGRKQPIPVDELVEAHRSQLFAYSALEGQEHYGDASIHLDYFRRVPGWEYLGYDCLLMDPFQVLVVLRPS